MDVPKTVTAALDDRPIEGTICLEAGAGVGNTTAGLLSSGAARVYAVTNDREHARTTARRVRGTLDDAERNCRGADDRLAVLEADLRELPLPDDAVDVVTAHGLFNVVPPADLGSIAEELTRVSKVGGHLVVDDYEPLPDDAAIRDLFAVENAVTELSEGRPKLSFYPSDDLRRLFAGYGWKFERRRTLLAPVPWTESHLEAHAAVARSSAADLPPELGEPLVERAETLVETIGEESVGEMYSLAMTAR